ncbi:hypothetical protein Adt_11497 [Abeliophyllum distichum]|uniref:Uncharacterized protein n=1 Tax=Abeliophyllum distichum TaxID=126358 RepID=A0ABD1UPR1_9LAMI
MEREQRAGDRDNNSSKKVVVGMCEHRRLGTHEGGAFGIGKIAGAVSQCLREEKLQQWAGDRESNNSEKVAVDLREHQRLGAREGEAPLGERKSQAEGSAFEEGKIAEVKGRGVFVLSFTHKALGC